MNNSTKNISSRSESRELRKSAFYSYTNSGFKKVAFDTRRIDQETEFNPRRGLQNYNRSEAFLSENVANKISSLNKLRNVLESLRHEFGREHEWQDSKARVLLATLDNGLRINQHDGDFSTNQPAQGSLDYIEELLHVRYRLNVNDLVTLGSEDLKKIILSKDEDLVNREVKRILDAPSNNISKQSYDTLMEKLFNVNATNENPDVERTITITIRDRLHKEG